MAIVCVCVCVWLITCLVNFVFTRDRWGGNKWVLVWCGGRWASLIWISHLAWSLLSILSLSFIRNPMFENRDSQDSCKPSSSSSSSSQRKLVPHFPFFSLLRLISPPLSLSLALYFPLSLLWAVERSSGGGGVPFFGLGFDYNSAYSRVHFYETELDSTEDDGCSRNCLKDHPVDEQVSKRTSPECPALPQNPL